MHSFTDFLSGKGEEINAELISHFQVLTDTLSSDMDIVNTVTAENTEFLELTKSGVLQVTGTTPVKKTPAALSAIQSTRPHEDIKVESRSNLSAKRTLEESSETEQSFSEDTSEPSFMSPSKTAKLSEKMEQQQQQASGVVDAENVAPIVNLGYSSFDNDDDDLSVTSKGSTCSSVSSSSSSRGMKRAASAKSQVASPKLKRGSSKTRATSSRALL
jgi:hypothetical protein